MFRLYHGLVRGNEWYNHAECVEIQGGALAALDSKERTGAGRLMHLVRASVPKLFTQSGKALELTHEDYLDMALVDGWKIIPEAMKLAQGTEFPSFQESFMCPRCSSHKRQVYTDVDESWQKLIEKGIISEHYLDSKEEMEFETVLPVGFDVQGNRQVSEGSYNVIRRRHIRFRDMIDIQENPTAMETEANHVYFAWDASIVEVEGMPERDLTILRRNPKESFSKAYITAPQDVEAMSEQPPLGLDAEFRKVNCKSCSANVGGSLDFSNFFSGFTRKRPGRTTSTQKTGPKSSSTSRTASKATPTTAGG